MTNFYPFKNKLRNSSLLKIIASTRYVNCEVMIEEMKTSINLIKLGEMEFDAILGMNWLSACGAHVDCNRK